MAILTATQCTLYSSITASAATIAASGLIPIVQERVCMMTNNYFLLDLYLQGAVTFDPSALTIVSEASFESAGFADGDDVLIYGSYRNEGVVEVASVSGVTLTLASSQSVVDELSGASVLITVVRWPKPVQEVAALMIAYDYDVRDKQAPNVRSHSLGPLSESFGGSDEDEYGYPRKITDKLIPYRIARAM